MWVTASGVPIVNAPFSTPVRKATPPDQPVAFSKLVHTNALEECFFGIAANTTIVTKPPTSTTNSPKCCR